MLTGTDEHGMKIQKAAQKANMDTKMFCDMNMKQFEQLAQKADIGYDHFIRTTDTDHKAAVEHVWRELSHRGYIYESKHEGWYSVSDEAFYPQSAIHLIRDPATGRKMMVSMETGKEVEWTEEINYHFKLSKFRDRLLKHFEENPNFIVPVSRMKNVIKDVTDGLQDLSISRPVQRLNWGVRVPSDDTQTVYVWLDALINYLTKAGYPFGPGTNTESIWPPDCQVIGKDIVRFHCIYWPAFLMALNLPLPQQILTHAHWTMNREKMSKSTGNVVNPFFAIDRFDVDTMRFYMAHDGGITDDSDYENAYIIDRYKKALQGGLGNLVSRVTRGKRWSVSSSVKRAEFEYAQVKPLFDWEHRTTIVNTPRVAAQQMEDLNPRGAVHTVMELIYQVSLAHKRLDKGLILHRPTDICIILACGTWSRMKTKEFKQMSTGSSTCVLSPFESLQFCCSLLCLRKWNGVSTCLAWIRAKGRSSTPNLVQISLMECLWSSWAKPDPKARYSLHS